MLLPGKNYQQNEEAIYRIEEYSYTTYLRYSINKQNILEIHPSKF